MTEKHKGPFYIVWCENELCTSTRKHETLQGALLEAQKRAKSNVQSRFYVLRTSARIAPYKQTLELYEELEPETVQATENPQ